MRNRLTAVSALFVSIFAVAVHPASAQSAEVSGGYQYLAAKGSNDSEFEKFKKVGTVKSPAMPGARSRRQRRRQLQNHNGRTE
jgi:hypothetical protein